MNEPENHFRKLERMYLSAPINSGFYKGITLVISDEKAELTLKIEPKFFHAAHAIHGSVYFKMLDDAAFFYFLRTIPLEVGKSYKYDRYFKKDLNLVVIKVVKREKMELPDGKEVTCLILNPVVGEEGLFAPKSRAMLWLTDDERRLPVQIRAKLPFGTVTLRLEKISTEGAAE